jgi:hypothetical protein
LSELQNIISWIAVGIPVLPWVAGMLRYRLLSQAQRIMVWLMAAFISLSLINELLTHYTTDLLPMYHLYSVIEAAGFLWIFHARPSRVIPRTVWISLQSAMVAVFAGNLLLGGSLFEFPVVFRTCENVLLSGLVVYFFFRVISEMKILRLEREFLFWVALGIMILFPGNLLLDVFGAGVRLRFDVYWDVWTIRSVLIIIAYPIFTIGILCKDPQPIS